MKLSFKKVAAALLAGALLAGPTVSPVQLTASAAEMTDQEREERLDEYRRENGITTGSLPAPPPSSNRGATASVPAVAAANNFNFTPSSKVSGTDMMASVRSYHAKSDKVVGWVYVPDTNINEPIVLDSKQPNSYYETRTWDGVNYPGNTWTNYQHTATFLDRRVKVGTTWANSSRNTVLYGHNWTNLRNPLDIGNVSRHVMFGQLPSYVDMTFAQNHPYIYYSTAENEGVWKVFASFYCETSSAFPYNTPNPSAEVFAADLQEYKNRSIYDWSTDVNASDRIITLSTCTRVYGDHANQAFVVMARLLREGESDNDPVTLSVNTDMKKPLL